PKSPAPGRRGDSTGAGAGPNGSTVSFDPRSLDLPVAWGEKRLDQPIPVKTLPGQRAAPCDTGIGQGEINGNCWFAKKPGPCRTARGRATRPCSTVRRSLQNRPPAHPGGMTKPPKKKRSQSEIAEEKALARGRCPLGAAGTGARTTWRLAGRTLSALEGP